MLLGYSSYDNKKGIMSAPLIPRITSTMNGTSITIIYRLDLRFGP